MVFYEIKEWFNGKRLKQKIKILISIILCIYVVVLIIAYQLMMNLVISNYADELNKNTIISISNNLVNEIETVSVMSQLIMRNEQVRDFLNSSPDKVTVKGYKAITAMHNIEMSFEDILSIYIFKLDGHYIDIGNNMTHLDMEVIKKKEWYESLINKAGNYEIAINGKGAFETKSGKPVLSLIRIINDVQTQKPIGMLVVNCSDRLLSKSYKNLLNNNQGFAYMDESPTILVQDNNFRPSNINYEVDEGKIEIQKIGNAKFYYYKIKDLPLTLAVYEQVSLLKYIPYFALSMIVILIIITLLSVGVIGLFVSSSIIKPVEKLVSSMEETKEGWLRKVSMSLPNDEIGKLKDSYNRMLIEINNLINELIEKEKVMQQDKIDIMLEQIKPHFLYNILETIACLALEASRGEVYDALETLGAFYRRFLNGGSETIPIYEEIEIVKDYLKLQQLRYGDRVIQEYVIDTTVLHLEIPKLIIQPLVENALNHGIYPKGEKGIIRITIESLDNYIEIKVYDTGKGMSQEMIATCLKEESKTVGLKNTIKRIRYFYNYEDVCSIKSKEGHYCEVILKIPIGGRYV